MATPTPPPAITSQSTVKTDLLIVGTGPAGASLAAFLSRPPYSLTGIMISSSQTTSPQPRAHITNPAALECLRDIGLEQDCIKAATSGDCMTHTRWCHDMTGVEYARIHSWGNDPARMGDYNDASPCRHVDLPQTEFEPIVVRRASTQGWTTRFSTHLLSCTREGEWAISRVRDGLTGFEYNIKSRYLFGADGARSQVMRELKIPLNKKPGQGLALNVLVKVDLSKYVEERMGNLHWVFQPEKEYPDFAWSALVRMVKPWDEWMFILFPLPDKPWVEPTADQYESRIRDFVGKPDIPVTILDVSKWQINEIVAEYYSEGPIFCLGDAVHRHPPFNGLGSNTCVQDAFNLAWKVAYVSQGLAGPALLETYSTERQPVGVGVITRANQGIRDHTPVWDAMGLREETVEARMKVFDSLSAATAEGRTRRKGLRTALDGTAHEFHGLGVEMNQRYVSTAVYDADEKAAGRAAPDWPADPVLHHRVSSYPGHRLPHAWLNTRDPTRQISTIDLAGHGAFCLLTGIGGEPWKEAAHVVGKELRVTIAAHSIGWACDWEDVYGDWERKREIADSGCVLVRPDRFVCWRSFDLIDQHKDDCVAKLRSVMKSVLSLET